MRGSFLLLVTLISALAIRSQTNDTANLICSIEWDDGVVERVVYSHAAISITAYCFVDDSTLALLVHQQQKIILYSLGSKTVINQIELPFGAIDFDYHKGRFFVMDFDRIYVMNMSGQLEQDIRYTVPERTPFALEKFKIIDDRMIITIADGSTWELGSSGLKMIDSYYWYYKAGYKARAEKLNLLSFELSVLVADNQFVRRVIDINTYSLADDLATVRIIDIRNNQIAYDIETTTDNEGAMPRRFLIFTDFAGNILSKIEIPFIYGSFIKRPFVSSQNGITYSLSTTDALYFYELNSSDKKFVQLPVSSPKPYHYNSNPNIGEFDTIFENETEILTEKAGNNCVTRTQVWENAYKFRDLIWTATSTNILLTCTQITSGTYAKTPITTTGSKTSVPYKWGGGTDWADFPSLIAQGKYAGNKFCTRVDNNGNITYTNHECPNGTSNTGSSIVGVDCSGFVSRCWETGSYTTYSLPTISVNLGSASSTSNFANLKVGDIVNRVNYHVMLCMADVTNPSGTVSFMESRATDWKVVMDQYGATNLAGYTCYRYNHINDARLRLAQEISITPSNVAQGGSLSVNYRIGNYGSESWSGHVQLWIIQSNGNEVFLQSTPSPITLGQNQTSATYTFSTTSVSSPTGTTKLEVRVKNSSVCNSQRSYAVGNGNFANPRTFIITSGTSNYTISTSSNPSAGGTTTGSGTFPSGQTKTVTASPNTGYVFLNWTENGVQVSSNASYTFTLSSNRNLVANFSAVNYCSGQTNLTASSGSFSDGSGGSDYGNNADCKWLIQPSGATSIVLSFSAFNTESNYDFVKVYNGTTTSATLLGTFSGTSIPATLTATGGAMLVHFTSDGSVTRAGWSASYTSSSLPGCTGVAQYPSSTLTPTAAWQYQTSIYAGSYSVFNVTSGQTYIWSLCSADGGSSSYDSELTLRNHANNNYIAYSDDFCGDDAKITWTANFTGQVRVVVNKYKCQTNTIGSTLAYRIDCNLPSAVSVSGSGTHCNNVTLTASGGTGGTIYWQGATSNGTSTATQSTSRTVTSSGTYYFRAHNSCGWGPQGSATVTINYSPSSVAVSGGGSYCNTATLTASGGNGGTIYWQGTNSNGTSTATPASSRMVTSSGTYYFRAYNSQCGWGTAGSATVTINSLPASVTVSGGGTHCSSATLTASGGNGGTIYWQGTTSGGESFSIQSSSRTVTSSGTYYFRAHNGCGWGPQGSATVSINQPPSPVAVIGGGTYCNSTMLSASGGNGGTIYWQGTNSNGTSTSTQTTSQQVSSSGTYYFRAYNSQCGWGTAGSASVTINTAPSAVSVTGGGTQCNSALLTASGGSGGNIYWQGTTSNGTSTSVQANSRTVTSSGTYYFRAYNSCGWGPQGSVTVTIINTPSQPGPIAGNVSPSIGSTYTYSVVDVPGASSYTWTYSGGGTPAGTGSMCTLTPTSSGTLSVVANNACGASASRTLTLAASTLPGQPGLISGNITPCPGNTYTYSITPVSGALSYTWSYTGSGTPSGTGTTCTLSPGGSGVLSVTASNTHGTSVPRTLALTYTPAPAQPAPISGENAPCEGASYNYSIPTVSGADAYAWTYSGNGTPAGTGNSCSLVPVSSGVLSVLATNVCGSSPSSSKAITVNPLPALPDPISGQSVVCHGIPTVYTIASVPGAGSYTWSYTGGGALTGTGTSCTLTPVSSGTLSVVAHNTCGPGESRTFSVTVKTVPPQPGAITGNINPCEGVSHPYSISPVSGALSYIWTYSGSGLPLGSGFSCTLTPGSSGTLSVVATNACGNSVSRSINLYVINLPQQPQPIVGPTILCPSTQYVYNIPVVNGANAYSWNFTGTGNLVGNGTSCTLQAFSSGTLSVTANNTCGSGPVTSLNLTLISVPAQPDTIAGEPSPNYGAPNVYSISAVPFATDYVWNYSGNGSLSGNGTQCVLTPTSSGTLSVIASNLCGSSLARSLSLNISYLPAQPDTIIGNPIPCHGSSYTYSITPVPGATSYTWFYGGGGTLVDNGLSCSLTPTMSGTLSVTAHNAAGSSASQTMLLQVISLPARPGMINGTSTPCIGIDNAYSVIPIPNATSFTWQYSGSGSVNGTTNSCTLTPNNSGVITVIAHNACGTSESRTKTLTIKYTCPLPGIISGNPTPYSGKPYTYQIMAVTGASTYTWSYTGGGTLVENGTSCTLTPINSGVLSVTANNECGSSNIRTYGLSVIPIPDQPGPIVGEIFPCEGMSFTYSTTPVSHALSYYWSYSGGGTPSGSGTSCTLTPTSPGLLSVVATNVSGTSTPSEVYLNTQVLPGQPSSIAGAHEACQGSSYTYSILPVSGASSYLWTYTGTGVIVGNDTSCTLTPSSSGVLSVRPSNSCGDGIVRNLSITVSPLPMQPGVISGEPNPCQGTLYSYNLAPVPAASWYSWSYSGSGTPVGNTALCNLIPQSSGTISVTANNYCGSSLPAILSLNVNPVPSQPGTISGSNIVCEGSPSVYNISSVIGGMSYTWSYSGGGTISGSMTSCTLVAITSGVLSVAANNLCGPGDARNLSITVNPLPLQPSHMGGNETPCMNTQYSYSVPPVIGASSYTWAYSGGGTPSGSGVNANLIPTSSGIISVSANNACGAGPALSKSLMVVTLPAQPGSISGNPIVSAGNYETFSITAVPHATSYTWTYTGTGVLIPSLTTCTLTPTSSGILRVIASNPCGSGIERTLSITLVTGPEQPDLIIGDTLPCMGDTTVYSILPVMDATSYTWAYSGGGVVIPSGLSCTLLASTGGVLSVTAHNAQGTSLARTQLITMLTVPAQVPYISGPSSICEGQQYYFSWSSVPNASSYQCSYSWPGLLWWYPCQSFTPIQSGTLRIIASNQCGDGPEQSIYIDVLHPPAQPGLISGNLNPNIWSPNVYSIDRIPDADFYFWSYTGSGTLIELDTACSLTPISDGTLSVIAVNSCGISMTRTFDIIVSLIPAPPDSINGNPMPCQGDTNYYSISSVPGATSYTWTYSGSGVIIPAGENCTLIPTSNGVLNVTANSSHGSSAGCSLALSILTAPVQPSAIIGNITPCEGMQYDYLVSPLQNIVSYVWSYSGAGFLNESGASCTLFPTQDGVLSVYASNACGDGPSQTIGLVVSSPVAPGIVSGDTTPCFGANTTYSIPIVPNATNYIWAYSGLGVIHENGPSCSLNPETSGKLTVSALTQSCPVLFNLLIDVISSPVVWVDPYGIEVCGTSSVNLTAYGADEYLWNTGDTTQTISCQVSVTSLFSVTGTSPSGCAGTAVSEVVVKAIPVVELGNDRIIGVGGTVSIAANISGGSGSYIYFWSTGNDSTSSITVSPAATAQYALTVVDVMTLCDTYDSVTVHVVSVTGSIGGKVRYKNATSTPLTNTLVLLSQNGSVVASTYSDGNGDYHFDSLVVGDYLIHAIPVKPFGGSNSNDALLILKHFASNPPLVGLNMHAGDVTGEGAVNAQDALRVAQRFVTLINSFPAGDWVSEINPVTIPPSGGFVLNDLFVLCRGDVNGSHTPSAKASATVTIQNAGMQQIIPGSVFAIPIRVSENLMIGAISLVLNYPDEAFEVKDVLLGDQKVQVLYHDNEGELRISWYDTDPLFVRKGDAILTANMIMKNLDAHTFSRPVFSATAESQIHDENAILYPYLELTVPRLEKPAEEVSLSIYPNPGQDYFRFDFVLPENGHMSLGIYNTLGAEVAMVANDEYYSAGEHSIHCQVGQLPAGLYYYRFKFMGRHSYLPQKGVMLILR